MSMPMGWLLPDDSSVEISRHGHHWQNLERTERLTLTKRTVRRRQSTRNCGLAEVGATASRQQGRDRRQRWTKRTQLVCLVLVADHERSQAKRHTRPSFQQRFSPDNAIDTKSPPSVSYVAVRYDTAHTFVNCCIWQRAVYHGTAMVMVPFVAGDILRHICAV